MPARVFHMNNYKTINKYNSHVIDYWQHKIDTLPDDMRLSGLEYAELRQIILSEQGYNRQARENFLVKDLLSLPAFKELK